MAPPNRPRYRADRDTWVSQVDGRLVTLARGKRNRAAADRALRALLVKRDRGQPVAVVGPSVAELVTRFLADCNGRVERGELSPATAEHYTHHLLRLGKALGTAEAESVRPAQIQAWLDAHPTWGATMRAGAVTAVKRLYRWARRLRLLGADPLADLEKPRPRRRDRIPDAMGARQALEACAAPEFRLFLEILYQTGCRPGEARALAARDLDLRRGLWHRPGKTSHTTGRDRVVHLPPGLIGRLAELAEQHPDGPLLRNTRGEPWSQTALNTQIRRLRARIGAGRELTCYALRHLFATDALDQGVPVATVAELLGHSSTKMVSERYSHLSERHEHLKEALGKVRGGQTS